MQKNKVSSQKIEITHPQKVLFPEDGFKKEDVVDYYGKIARFMLPYLKDRPISMHRFPDGISHEGFFQKEVSDYFPKWLKTVVIKKEGGKLKQLVCNTSDSLVYIANQACITPHIWLSKIDKIDYPDKLVLDLDPPKNGFELARKMAFELKRLIEDLGAIPYVMTTGSKGLHVVIALDQKCNYSEAKSFAEDVAKTIEKKYPKLVTTEIRKGKRGQRLFIDTARNSYAQTSVAPYAIRAKDGAPVATPLAWDELRGEKITAQSFNMKNIFLRLKKKGNVWGDFGKKRFSIKKLNQKLKKAHI